MKKIFTLIFVSLMLLCVAGCGGKTDTSDLKKMTTEHGLSICVTKDAEVDSEEEDSELFLYSEEPNYALDVMFESYESLVEYGYTEETDIDYYMEDISEIYEQGFEKEKDGHYYSINYREFEDGDIAYYETVRKGEQGFFFISFYCLKDELDANLPIFQKMMKTVEVK